MKTQYVVQANRKNRTQWEKEGKVTMKIMKIGAAAGLLMLVGCRASNTTSQIPFFDWIRLDGTTRQTKPPVPVDSIGDKYIATVKNGVLLEPYNTTTIGKAFEATFSNPKWSTFESAKGQRVVEFEGQLKPEAYKETFDHIKKCIDSAEVINCSALFGGWAGTADFRHTHTDTEIEVAASTVTFQFVFDATDASSFCLSYIDPDPWSNVAGFPGDNNLQKWVISYIYN